VPVLVEDGGFEISKEKVDIQSKTYKTMV